MSEPNNLYIGVDVGGTKILAVVATANGEIIARAKHPTDPDSGSVASQIGDAIEAVLAQTSISPCETGGIGVALPGVVDSKRGILVHAPNLDVADPEISARLEERFDLPVSLGNDANLGTLAEVWTGAGRGADTVVGIFVGTGIGGGVVVNGRLQTGSEDKGGEIGHLVLMIDGPECGCGNLGCWEALASRTAIERHIRAELDTGRESCILRYTTDGRIKSGALAKALSDGDELVTEVMRREAHYLAQGVLSIRHMIDPDFVIFGGGVIEACAEFLMPLIETEIRQDHLLGSTENLQLRVAELGDDAVVLGAAALIHSHLHGDTLEGLIPGDIAEESVSEGGAPHIDSVAFGSVIIDGEEFTTDIYIRADGTVRERKKRYARRKYGTANVLDAAELGKVCKGAPETLVIGNGFDSQLHLTDDAAKQLSTSELSWHSMATQEAVDAYNRAKSPKALFLHLKC